MESNIYVTNLENIILPHEAIVEEDCQIEDADHDDFLRIIVNDSKDTAD